MKVETSHVDEIPEIEQNRIDWGGISRTPLLHIPKEMTNKVAYYIFLESPHIGEIVAPKSIVYSCIEIAHDGNLLNANPCLSNKGC